jgi:hypothetical protein
MVKYVYVMDRCPICGSNNIERDDVEFESNCIWYPCTCTDCGKVFNEVYPFADSYVEWED